MILLVTLELDWAKPLRLAISLILNKAVPTVGPVTVLYKLALPVQVNMDCASITMSLSLPL